MRTLTRNACITALLFCLTPQLHAQAPQRTLVGWGGVAISAFPLGAKIKTIAAGHNHNLAITEKGELMLWGNNYDNRSTAPSGLGEVIAIAGGVFHSVAVKKDGTVVAWEGNDRGQVNVPPGLSGVVAISAGVSHTIHSLSAGAKTIKFRAFNSSQYILEHGPQLSGPWTANPITGTNDVNVTMQPGYYRLKEN